MNQLYPGARLTIDLGAIAANWRRFAALGPACGAALKADAYGLGIALVARRLWQEGCRSYFVATLAEGEALRKTLPEAEILLLHGVLAGDVAKARSARLLPVLNSPEQIAAWRETGEVCALMVDTGIGRLGLRLEHLDALEGLMPSLVMSHLACADEPGHPLNRQQLERFFTLRNRWPQARASLANSCGALLGADYRFDLLRPGIGLFGGIADTQTVFAVTSRIHQQRTIPPGESVGYGATWTAVRPTPVATLATGYADGYLRSFSGRGVAHWQGIALPVIGRVSMDMVTLDISAAPHLQAGDEVSLLGGAVHLTEASRQSGLSTYELLTGLGARYERSYRE